MQHFANHNIMINRTHVNTGVSKISDSVKSSKKIVSSGGIAHPVTLVFTGAHVGETVGFDGVCVNVGALVVGRLVGGLRPTIGVA